jgi:hypothetical protein
MIFFTAAGALFSILLLRGVDEHPLTVVSANHDSTATSFN